MGGGAWADDGGGGGGGVVDGDYGAERTGVEAGQMQAEPHHEDEEKR